MALAGLVDVSRVQASVELTFDENGNSSGLAGITSTQGLDNNFAVVGLGSLQGSTVYSGGGSTTLDYLAPPIPPSTTLMEYGWVAIDDAKGNLVSLVHFDNVMADGNNAVNDQMFYYAFNNAGNEASKNYSGNDFSGLTLGRIANILNSANTVTITEDANGDAFYDPSTYYGTNETLAQAESAPGFNLGLTGTNGVFRAAATQYSFEFIGGTVPEPGSYGAVAGVLVLLSIGGGSWRQRIRKP